MKTIRLVLLTFAVSVFVLSVGYGCAKKQVKGEEGLNKGAQETTAPTGPETKGPTEAPPGPKEQPEPAENLKPEQALDDVHFDFNKYDIRPSEAKVLGKDAAWMKANPVYVVTIEGHCDERGTVEYNLALGERRAESARKYLVSLGIDNARMKTISYGKNKPMDLGHDEEAWAKNRRAHIVVVK